MQPITTMAQAPSATMPNQNAPALQLHDIHLPAEINDYPIAIGWWILAIIILIAIVQLITKIRQNIDINKHKKLALYQLSNNVEMKLSDTISLLKWVAIQYFDRHEIAKLYGKNLQIFLLKKLPLKHQQTFTELTTLGFSSQYKKESKHEFNKDFNLGAIHWITYALPTKNKRNVKKESK